MFVICKKLLIGLCLIYLFLLLVLIIMVIFGKLEVCDVMCGVIVIIFFEVGVCIGNWW